MRPRTFLRLVSLAGAVGAWLVVAACSSGGGKPVDASVDNFTVDYTFGELPPGCPPAAGNEKNVGAPCTKGNKSSDCPPGLLCTCEMALGVTPPADTPCFCTLPLLKPCDDPTIPAGYCGTGARCCGYQQVASLCVPDVCLQEMMCPTF